MFASFFWVMKYWAYSKTGEIRRDETCLDYAGSEVVLYPCHGALGNQNWHYDPQVTCSFIHETS